jgi:ABC-type methionine transport system ATPase subunit
MNCSTIALEGQGDKLVSELSGVKQRVAIARALGTQGTFAR